MHRSLSSLSALLIALAVAAGCAKPAASSPPASAGGGEAPPSTSPGDDPGAPPVGSKFYCLLSCSGTETKAYGLSEEEAHENVRAFVSEKCRPDDGQYFIVCDPVE